MKVLVHIARPRVVLPKLPEHIVSNSFQNAPYIIWAFSSDKILYIRLVIGSGTRNPGENPYFFGTQTQHSKPKTREFQNFGKKPF